ncbi:MAG: tripartite tricarboxylate transporter substrate binding protein [Burkholderiales bacterium]|nr:tripartite tricarboxylate transporter substrate binding protein [Burkholderiales bacterium]
MQIPTRFLIAIGTAALSATVSVPVQAQGYPTKSIRIIVPYAPGGGTDTVARALAQRMTESLGQQIVIENRAGANGIIGSEIVAKAAPDGHLLLMTTNALTVNPWLYKMPFDTLNDFTPVTMTSTACSLLAVHPSLPVSNVGDLVALARKRPGQLVMSASGAGQPSHLSGELLKQMAKIDFLIVQYKGTGASLADLAGGHVMISFSSVPGLMPLVQSGKLRALGTSCRERVPGLKAFNIPAVAETIPGFEVVTWYGLMAPAKTPQEIVTRLHGEIVKALARPDMKKFLDGRGFESGGMTPDQFSREIREEMARWEKVVKQAGIKAQ